MQSPESLWTDSIREIKTIKEKQPVDIDAINWEEIWELVLLCFFLNQEFTVIGMPVRYSSEDVKFPETCWLHNCAF